MNNALGPIWNPAAPTADAVGLVDLRAHLRVTDDAEDNVIKAYGAAAVAFIENRTQVLLTRRSCTMWFPSFPANNGPMELRGGLVSELEYIKVDGEEIEGCSYLPSTPSALITSTYWPNPEGTPYPIEVRYKAGYTKLPADLASAVKLVVGELYEKRSNSETNAALSEVPLSVKILLAPYRVWSSNDW